MQILTHLRLTWFHFLHRSKYNAFFQNQSSIKTLRSMMMSGKSKWFPSATNCADTFRQRMWTWQHAIEPFTRCSVLQCWTRVLFAMFPAIPCLSFVNWKTYSPIFRLRPSSQASGHTCPPMNHMLSVNPVSANRSLLFIFWSVYIWLSNKDYQINEMETDSKGTVLYWSSASNCREVDALRARVR